MHSPISNLIEVMWSKVLGVPDVMRGVPYKWSEDVSQLLGHSIHDHTSAGYYGPKWDALLVFSASHRILVDLHLLDIVFCMCCPLVFLVPC